MNCQNQDINKERCTCPYTTCSRHGICCECVAYHKKEGGLPDCLK